LESGPIREPVRSLKPLKYSFAIGDLKWRKETPPRRAPQKNRIGIVISHGLWAERSYRITKSRRFPAISEVNATNYWAVIRPGKRKSRIAVRKKFRKPIRNPFIDYAGAHDRTPGWL
jgi:hypothetical protein